MFEKLWLQVFLKNEWNSIFYMYRIFKNNAEIYQIVGSQNVLYNMFREAEWTTSYDKHKIFLKILAISLKFEHLSIYLDTKLETNKVFKMVLTIMPS